MSDTQIEVLKCELAKPVSGTSPFGFQLHRGDPDLFDPWRVFPSLYGSYSSEFDDMAILVIDNILQKRWGADYGESLAHEMFREMLCTAGLCDYGTSPRGCFPQWLQWGDNTSVLLTPFLEKWRAYRITHWSDDSPTTDQQDPA